MVGVPWQVLSVSSGETTPLLGRHVAVLAATAGDTAFGVGPLPAPLFLPTGAGLGRPGETVSGGVWKGTVGSGGGAQAWVSPTSHQCRHGRPPREQGARRGGAVPASPAPGDRERDYVDGNGVVVVVVVASFCVDVTWQFGCEVPTRGSLPAQGAAAVTGRPLPPL